jgi:tRNA uridine 5-carbamoylmethylation protein Kti12
MAKIYVMCGLPFSGKTTLSKKMAVFTRYTRVSFDELWVRLEKSDLDFPKDKTQGWKYVNGKCEEILIGELKKNKSVIYDNLGGRVEHRDVVRDIGKRFISDVIVIYLKTPFNIIKERQLRNRKNNERHSVEKDNFNNSILQFQEPTKNENVFIFKPNDNAETWLTKYIKME